MIIERRYGLEAASIAALQKVLPDDCVIGPAVGYAANALLIRRGDAHYIVWSIPAQSPTGGFLHAVNRDGVMFGSSGPVRDPEIETILKGLA